MKSVTDSAGSVSFGEAVWNYVKYGAICKAYTLAVTKEHKISFNRSFSFIPAAAGLKINAGRDILMLVTVNIVQDVQASHFAPSVWTGC